MDILSELFRESGLRRRLLNVHSVPDDRVLRFPCDRSVGFHVVVAGTVHVHVDDPWSPIVLGPGDLVFMGRGAIHHLSTAQEIRGRPVVDISLDPSWKVAGTGAVRVVSGAYQLWNAPVHPFFTQLPTWFMLPAERAPRLGPVGLTVAMLTEEVERGGLGSETVQHALLDVLFTHLLREMVDRQGATQPGWSHAVRDPQIRQAVALLHEAPARDWTVEALARQVGVSRSVLAARFRATMGETPLAYLRTLRIQRAMRLLAESSRTLEQVAVEVGYQDAFGFSKAFKRAVGEAPGEFRRRDRAERDLPWRLRASETVGTG